MNRLPRIALATSADYPTLSPDDRLLPGAFADLGVTATATVWSDRAVDWTAFDAVLIRSCWDYHLHLDAFQRWLDHLDAIGAAVWNPPAVVRWNASKTYLLELERAGVPGIPTRWIRRGDAVSLASVLADAGWDDAVVKPVVSASAHGTWLTSRAAAGLDEARFQAAAAAGDLLVQRFEQTVTREGEWSLMFIDGAFSHAVRKRPRAGDFRVQTEHGGTWAAEEAPAEVLRGAIAALDAAPGGRDVLYARVDGCVVDGRFVLMELELIEPLLFLGCRAGAAGTLARAMLRRIGVEGVSASRTA